MNKTIKRKSNLSGFFPGMLMVLAAIVVVGAIAGGTVQGRADNFTDIFYTNSFRGAFEWIKKLDWVGMIVQAVISVFSLFGVALLTIRIMTSMLFLSAKGMWEEVHDLKSGGETMEKDLFGMGGMLKSWTSGKAGTGLDAIVGAVLLLLPDVKRYSDFGEKAGGDFSDDITITQYILKIALDENNEAIGYRFVKLGPMLQDIRRGMDPTEAFNKHQGTYGRFENAPKYIDPREE